MSDDDFDYEDDCHEVSDELDYYHDKGEADASSDDWSPPHDTTFTMSRKRMRRYECENHWYAKGFFNTRGQIDGSNNDYNPPSWPHDQYKEIYDEAYEAARANYTPPEDTDT